MRTLAAFLGVSCLGGTGVACAPTTDQEPAADEAASPRAEEAILLGEALELGAGGAQTFVELDPDGQPSVVGVRFDESLLDDLPTEPDGTMACFDADADGRIDPGEECMLGVQRNLRMPDGSPASLPFQWVGLNWNPGGHPAPAPPAYGVPHFDFHFYLPSPEQIDEIRPGTCGFMVDCEVFERARIPVPERYMPEDYIEVGAVAAGEGNHLLDSKSPELGDPPAAFTHTLIYGAHEGRIIFVEPMIAASFIASQPDECHPIKLPEAWEVAGHYPTEYCMRYLPEERAYRVSLEGFVERQGT